MASSILSVPLPVELKNRLKAHPEIRWVEVVRIELAKRLDLLDELDKMDEIFKNSTITEADAVRIGREIKKSQWKRHEKPALDKYLSSLTRTSSSRRSPATG